MSAEQARAALTDIGAAAHILDLLSSTTFRAVDGVVRHGLSFWDALIWAAALEHGIPIVYTEDCPGAREIEGIRYVNPFADMA